MQMSRSSMTKRTNKKYGIISAALIALLMLPAVPALVQPSANVGGGGEGPNELNYGFLGASPFVPVTDITGVPTTATVGVPLTLTGTVTPSNATDQNILWRIKDAGTTGAYLSGNVLTTSSAGTVTVTATIEDGALNEFATVSAGCIHTVAVNSAGELYAWGRNDSGQLGDGTNVIESIPTRIGTASNWVTVSAGYEHTVAVNSAGELYAWGNNYCGQLGNGINIPRKVVNDETMIFEKDFIITVNSGITIDPALIGTATISNTSPRIGDILNGSLSGGNNSGTLSYQWKADGTNVGTGSSYTVTVADLGKAITLEITSSVETGMITSTATLPVVKKAAPAAPPTPAVDSKTHNSVTLAANSLYQFSSDGATWQDSNVFTGLSANTQYTFYQRVKETSDTLPSGAGPGLNATTYVAPVAPTITSANSTSVVNGTGGTFQVTATGAAPITYSLSGQPSGVSINFSTGVMTIAGTVAANTYTFTITASNGTAPNATQSFTLTVNAAQPAAFTISYNNNGGSGTVTSQTVNSGISFTVKSSTGMTAPNGKQFKSWNTQANGSGTSYAPGASVTAQSNMTLYAVWETIPSTTGGSSNNDGSNNIFSDPMVLIIIAVVAIALVCGVIFAVMRRH